VVSEDTNNCNGVVKIGSTFITSDNTFSVELEGWLAGFYCNGDGSVSNGGCKSRVGVLLEEVITSDLDNSWN